MSSESPSTVFSVFIISDKVFNQSWSSDTALSNFGQGDALSLAKNKETLSPLKKSSRKKKPYTNLGEIKTNQYGREQLKMDE